MHKHSKELNKGLKGQSWLVHGEPRVLNAEEPVAGPLASVLGPVALSYQPDNVMDTFRMLITSLFLVYTKTKVLSLNSKSAKGAYT